MPTKMRLINLLLFLVSVYFASTVAKSPMNAFNDHSQSFEVEDNRKEYQTEENIRITEIKSPTAAPTYSPADDAYCRSLSSSYSNNTFAACTTCVLADCRYCLTDNYCFGTDDGTCSDWVEGSSNSVCSWSGNFGLIVAIIVIVVILLCCCIGGVAALLCCGVPACCATMCYCIVKKSTSPGQSTVVPAAANYAPVPTPPVMQPVGQQSYMAPSSQFQTPYQSQPYPYQTAQPVSIQNSTDKEYAPLAQVVSIDSNYNSQIGEKAV